MHIITNYLISLKMSSPPASSRPGLTHHLHHPESEFANEFANPQDSPQPSLMFQALGWAVTASSQEEQVSVMCPDRPSPPKGRLCSLKHKLRRNTPVSPWEKVSSSNPLDQQGQATSSWTKIIDYRGLNDITIKNRYPLHCFFLFFVRPQEYLSPGTH